MPENKKFKEALQKEGLKSTKHRNLILELLEEAQEPLSAEEIFDWVRKQGDSISLSTVYRSLEKLTSGNLLIKSDLKDDGKARYELFQERHKHYMICKKCNKVIAVDGCPLEEYARALQKQMDFDVTGHKLEIYGYCQDCKLR